MVRRADPTDGGIVHLLQVCNVGRILGGTAACAWTVTRCFPDAQHTLAFLSRPTAATRAAFEHCEVLAWDRVTPSLVDDCGADVVLLHNTAARSLAAELPVFTIAYVHSRIEPAAGDLTLYCSRWLASQCGADESSVLYQAVPSATRPDCSSDTRALRSDPIIGRLCTPVSHKWPEQLVGFYRDLARSHPQVEWEFVGCPTKLRTALEDACGGRARFWDADWEARSRFWQWDALLYHHPTLSESFGRTAAEAMRCGCVPIVDDRGGFVEQVAKGCGYLCREMSDFNAAIAELSDPGARRHMSRAARAHADRAFSLQRFRGELLERLDGLAHV